MSALCAMTENRVDTDLWGHVVYGREVIRDGRLPETTTWSYVTDDFRWINHENLSELLLAWTADHFGNLGLTFGKLLLALVIVGCWIWTARRSGIGWPAIAILAIVASQTMRFHWHFRPQALGYVSFAVMLAVFVAAFRGWQASLWKPRASQFAAHVDSPCDSIAEFDTAQLRWLWSLLPLFVVWVNAHGGFAAGLAVLWAYLGLRGLEAFQTWGRRAWPIVAQLFAVCIACTLITGINPYGFELHTWLAYDVGAERPEIADWRPIDMLNDPVAVGLWMLLVIGVSALSLTRRRRDVTEIILLTILLWQSVSHCRHLCFFAIAAAYWLMPHVDDVVRRLVADFQARLAPNADGTRRGRSPRVCGWGLIAVTILMAGALAPRMTTVPVRRDWYPVSAMQYVSDRGLTGRFLVEFNWAQYAIMCFAEDPPAARESRVAVDGRLRTCYPWETLDIYLDFYLGNGGPDKRNRSPQAPAFQADRALEIGSPDLLLLWREHKHSVATVEARKGDWVLLYQDQLAQLWGRRDRYDDATSPDYIAPANRSISDSPQVGVVPWPALPQRTQQSAVSGLAAR
jgi:hypothetical protein